MFEAINRERVQLDLDPLELDGRLIYLARFRSQDMVDNDYFSHLAPDGATARSLMIAARIGPGLMGEILGRNNAPDISESVASVIEAFMNSPGHRRTILDSRFTSAGLGIAIGPGEMKYYTVLFFGP